MKMQSYFRSLVVSAVALLAGLTACTDDTTESQVLLHYKDISDIGPSMTFTIPAPSYKGSQPSEFAIESITRDGGAFADLTPCFAVEPTSGSITISNTSNLETGLYSLSLSCMAGGQRNFFPDVVKVRMLSAAPTGIEVTPSVLEIPYDEVKTATVSAQISLVGESVTVSKYELVQEEGMEYFAVSKEGVISVNSKFEPEMLPGVYTPKVKITSLAGAATYEGAVTIKIASEPLAVTYKPAEGRSEFNAAFSSPVPVLKGSTEGGVTWTLKSVSPETDKFAVDALTGIVSLAADNGLAIDNVYTLDLTVANKYGSVDFAGAYSVKIVAFITPIDPATFVYEDAETIQGVAFDIEKKAGFVGDEVSFSLGTLPTELEGRVTIDEDSGKISIKKGSAIAIGEYQIPVTATNVKGSVSATAKLTVKENPYYFTTINYGNNLGLVPESAYASQYRYTTAAQLVAASGMLPTTDAKEGTELQWSVKLGWKMSGATINATTGALTFVTSSFDTAAKNGLLLVTATAGKGEVGETSVTIPVFFALTDGVISGVGVTATPFVYQVNPKTGGKSDMGLTVTGTDVSKFLIDFRRTFQYYNINGPASHVSGAQKAGVSPTPFLNLLCEQYAEDVKSATGKPITIPYGAKDLHSYYINRDRGTLSLAAVYVEPATFKLVVNPERWKNEDGYANGCFFGDMTYVVDGDETKISSGTATRPVWIWFDEKF